MTEIVRCGWAGSDPLYCAYHDTEWGVPEHDDGELFERLVLEGFQAGLSWITILRKREAFRTAFANWDAGAIAHFGDDDIARLLQDSGIIRNRLKIAATIRNARAYLEVRDQFGDFASQVWKYVDGTPVVNLPATHADIPAFDDRAVAMSKDLKRLGFTFVGPTICYAFMQSVGMVDDHVVGCFRKSR